MGTEPNQLTGTTGQPKSSFVLPADLIRPLAFRRAGLYRAEQPDEGWFATQVEVYEQPCEAVAKIDQDSELRVTTLRVPALRDAYTIVKRWIGKVPKKPDVRSIFPTSWIQALAYRRFEERGRVHGHDKEDWFAAKSQLFEKFLPFVVEEGWSWELWNTLRLGTIEQAIARLTDLSPANDRMSRAPSSLKVRKPKLRPLIKTIEHPTSDELKLAAAVKSPVALLAPGELEKYRGCLIAVLDSGSDKGQIIAQAPLDYDHPEVPRKAIKRQVGASAHKNRSYQIRQVLAE